MAHPMADKRGRIVGLDDIADLAAAGMAGLEVDHRDNAEEDRLVLRELARDLDLLITGSSDYHGTGRATGSPRTPPVPRCWSRSSSSARRNGWSGPPICTDPTICTDRRGTSIDDRTRTGP